MELNIKCILLASIVLFVLIRQGLAIKCWDCRSDFDPKCSDPFDNSTFYMTDCAQQKLEFLPGARSTMCRKIRQKIHGTWRYMRSCAYLGEPGIQGDERFCLMRTGTYNIFMEYCTCNSKDGCNTSSHLQSAHAVSLVAIILSVCMYLRRV
ncbi:UPAR/Ly6 domain-containing protein crok [Atheta coriaria]|uniref:UPAR/Ly6 domain-containing protein crok n=1 Tax=Dalotia coriaria TaxID=877792 RepID=UPI0031F38D02